MITWLKAWWRRNFCYEVNPNVFTNLYAPPVSEWQSIEANPPHDGQLVIFDGQHVCGLYRYRTRVPDIDQPFSYDTSGVLCMVGHDGREYGAGNSRRGRITNPKGFWKPLN